LPSIPISQIYAFVAMAAVSTILIATFNSYTVTLRSASESEQLRNLLNSTAAQGNELLALTAATNSTARVFLQMPTSIGYKQYWIRAQNDSLKAWLDGGLGPFSESEATYRIFFPRNVSASGQYVGGYGPAVLESYLNGSALQLNLSSVGG
jgi:hypothetical protein